MKVAQLLHKLANQYVMLGAIVRPGSRTAADEIGTKVKRAESFPAPADLVVADTMRQIDEWTRDRINDLLNANVRAKADAVAASGKKMPKPWTPPTPTTTPAALRAIAEQRIGFFVPADDGVVALAFDIGVRRLVKLAAQTIEPSGRRWRDLHVQCIERVEIDGALVECTGSYGVWFDPHRQEIAPDLQCSKFPAEHTVTPVAWQRAGRRSGYDPEQLRERLKRERANS